MRIQYSTARPKMQILFIKFATFFINIGKRTGNYPHNRQSKTRRPKPSRFGSIFPDNRLYKADDFRLAAVDGFVIVIFR